MGTDLGYTLLDEIGSGAIATVVRVRVSDGRTLAGKILHTSRAQDSEAVERFGREAEFVAELDHPNVARVFGMQVIDGRDVLLMELVDGPPLDEVIAREAPLLSDRVIAIGRGLAAGLAAAHERGVVHRDLKPANVLLAEDDVPKIVDFGMARASSMQGVDPSAFAVLGTPDYMAPETLDPLAVDARADLYSLGCILFELAVGHPPFDGPTSFAVLEAHRLAAVPPLPDALPIRLRQLIEVLLAKAPADRVQSAQAVVAWLASLDEPAEVALAQRHGGTALASACASCGAPLVEALGVCLSCGLPAPVVEHGDHTLFVTGPGNVAEKFDSRLRLQLMHWIARNPGLSIDATRLASGIPRLPFCLLTAVSESSGRAIKASLDQLGIETTLQRGGRGSLPAARKKAMKMAGRTLAVIGASSVWMLSSQGSFYLTLLALIPMFLLLAIGTGMWTMRAFATPKGTTRAALPEALQKRLDAIGAAGPSLRAARHRDSLRGVVSSALALQRSVGELEPETTEEIGHGLDVALVAAGKLDQLDAELEHRDLRAVDAPTRALLGERDVWSSRLLELHATLDTLRARLAAASAAAGSHKDTEALDDLRAKVEALEEVQRG